MVSIELVGPAIVRGLACSYCGRPMPPDEAGMVAAHAAWGWCGAVAIDADRTVGLLLVSATTSVDPRVTVAWVGAGWVAATHARQGIGRGLLQALAAGLHRGRVGTLFAHSDSRRRCAALPPGFLDGTGFVAIDASDSWRLDLSGAVPAVKGSVLGRLGRLVRAVGPVAPPEPARRADLR